MQSGERILTKLFCCGAILLAAAAPASAQFRDVEPGGIRFGESRELGYRAGVVIQAVGGPCKGIVGYVPVPNEWPEQDVQIAAEEVSPEVKVSYEMLEGTVKLMLVRIPLLEGGKEAKATFTYKIRRRQILPPEKPDEFLLPNPKKLDRQLAAYLGKSPFIEVGDRKIASLAKELGAERSSAWQRVEAIYDFVREHVEHKKIVYRRGTCRGAVAALTERQGNHEDITCLFIAICRAAGIPARTVWVPEHCYAEFCLMDKSGKAHWFPCNPAGARAFGEMPDLRPILQKGDRFIPPWDRREVQRYMTEYLTGAQFPGSGQPVVRFIREPVEQF